MGLRPTLTAGMLLGIHCLVPTTIATAEAPASSPLPTVSPSAPSTAPRVSEARLAYGAYLARAGGCADCHTRPGGEPFAGGLGLQTPAGIVYTPNITPSREAGIGRFSDQDFLRAMHDGVAPNGLPYSPVFPYAFYARMPQDAVLAIKDYLFSLPPASYHAPPTRLRWPLDQRETLFGWQALHLDSRPWRADPAMSDEWNRGAYLVQGPGRCAACHGAPTAAGEDMGERAAEMLPSDADGALADWFGAGSAPALAEVVEGLSVDALAAVLGAGPGAADQDTADQDARMHSDPAAAAVIMTPAEIGRTTHAGLAWLARSDLRAIAVYLKAPAPGDVGTARSTAADADITDRGWRLYADYCSACHRPYGQGLGPYVPPMRGNAAVIAASPDEAIRAILLGAPAASAAAYSAHVVMPSFAELLNDHQVAALVSYLRASWGNDAPPVTADAVADIRAAAASSGP
ncbi:cytochrome c [Thiohalocapsa marina]|uniref:Cytochrome c n=1 Tax=Thiohalocapsa marina TaxID=424902 RepID=A0A5M8FSG4_9GAMM|nr:cytochrome c [Thiohalocapsa marina]KAA6186645.1 cytochrome c [Thiohalocapsa marina]